jgi:hypothetical protein
MPEAARQAPAEEERPGPEILRGAGEISHEFTSSLGIVARIPRPAGTWKWE